MAEPITLSLAKKHLRVDSAAEDDLITEIIADARSWVEDYTGQTLVQDSRALTLKSFTEQMLVWPIQSVAEVSYRDSAGVLQTLASSVYELDAIERPARLRLKSGQSWPAHGQIIVDLVAGYATAADIPGGMRRAMYLLIGGFYGMRATGGLDEGTAAAARRACGPKSRSWVL